MFCYGVVLILSPKMVYIKSKTVELERKSFVRMLQPQNHDH